jgi:hypothetical protein
VSAAIEAETLTRLRVMVEAGKPIPVDLARALLNALEAAANCEDRRARRDRHIRLAALLVDGSRWTRARVLAHEAAALDSAWKRVRWQTPQEMTVRGELHTAKLLHKLPGCVRQFYNIIPR